MADLFVEVYRVAHGRSAIMDAPAASGLGDVTFTASADHATVTSYEIRVRVYGNSTVVDAIDVGTPTPVGGLITVNIAEELSALAAGTYTVSVAAIGPGGTSESAESYPFLLPLA